MKSISSAIVIFAGMYGLVTAATSLTTLHSAGAMLNNSMLNSMIGGGQPAGNQPAGIYWMYLLLAVSLLLILFGLVSWSRCPRESR